MFLSKKLIEYHFIYVRCEKFNDISDQYWVRKQLYINVLDEHAPLKEKTLREDHVP